MLDRSLVTSGFDVEVLVSEAYIGYLLLAQIEAGLLPLVSTFTDAKSKHVITVTISPPTDYVRRYEPFPGAELPDAANGSFAVTLKPEGDPAFFSLLAWISTVDQTTGFAMTGPALIDLGLELVPGSVSPEGLEAQHTLKITLVGLDPGFAVLLTNNGVDVPSVEKSIRENLPPAAPLGLAQGQQVRSIRMRRFVTAQQNSLGLYVDLALKSDPVTYVDPRGDLDAAQDFRSEGAPMAFATAPSLFALLGPDARARQGEADGSGGWRYPLREDPTDPGSKEIGHINGITAGPEMVSDGQQPPHLRPSGRLLIDVDGDYTDAPGSPGFHLRLYFDPRVDGDGAVSWDPDLDVELGLLATVVLALAGVLLTVAFGPLGWGSSLLVGSILGVAVLKGLVAEPIAAKIIRDRFDVQSQASVLDVLPFRLPAASRRWDPFYSTSHLVMGLVDERPVIDESGIAFECARLALDREPVVLTDIVIRDEDRSVGSLASARYRVSDFAANAATFAAIAPGTDRREFALTDAAADPTLVSLTLAQIADRISSKRLFAPIHYRPMRIAKFENQVDQILVIGLTEIDEQRRAIENAFRVRMRIAVRNDSGDLITADVTAALEQQLGRPPTPQEIGAAVSARIESIIDGLMPDFRRELEPGLLDDALAKVMRFDLAPNEFIVLQKAGALILDGVEMLVRHNKDGSTTPYYRDHPDGDPRDNLLALPHYRHPYVPPH